MLIYVDMEALAPRKAAVQRAATSSSGHLIALPAVTAAILAPAAPHALLQVCFESDKSFYELFYCFEQLIVRMHRYTGLHRCC